MTPENLIALARAAAEEHAIDPALLCAVVHHESANWQMWAVRYEPAFFDHYIAPMSGLTSTEMHLRATSFGLTQIMGQTARELGFDRTYLTELLDPVINLEFGCRKLAACLKHSEGGVIGALLAYNGGSNPEYPTLVLRYLRRYTKGQS